MTKLIRQTLNKESITDLLKQHLTYKKYQKEISNLKKEKNKLYESFSRTIDPRDIEHRKDYLRVIHDYENRIISAYNKAELFLTDFPYAKLKGVKIKCLTPKKKNTH